MASFRASRGPVDTGAGSAGSSSGSQGASGPYGYSLAGSSAATAAAAPSLTALPPLAVVGSSGAAKARRPPRRSELTKEEVEEIRETFDLFDSDKDGLIDHHEFKVRMAHPCPHGVRSRLPVTPGRLTLERPLTPATRAPLRIGGHARSRL